MFAVSVSDSQTSQVSQPIHSDEQTLCKPHESVTVVYVKLNAHDLPAPAKSLLIHGVSDFLSLKPHHISVGTQSADVVDSSLALVSGPGDSALPADPSLMSTLSWVVGCGAVKSHHMDILEQLESSAKNGDLSQRLDVPVSGWQVQSNQPKFIKNRRLKRNVRATNTPVPASKYHGLRPQ